jgi:hypothetical protein
MLVASLMLAHQVAGKATRDALFLSEFHASYFPLIVIAGSAFAIAGGLFTSRMLQAFTPAQMVPLTFLASGGLHFVEWLLLAGPYRPAVVVLIYIHIVAFGAVALSGFWSLLNERFDPRSGKHYFGRIAGVGTLGGISGGVVAERFAVMLPSSAILIFLGGLHLLCGCVSFVVVARSRTLARREDSPFQNQEQRLTSAAWPVFRASPYLQRLAVLVLLGTSAAVLLDIVFKTQAATLISGGPKLLRFFAIFYTAGQVMSLAVQVLVTDKWLQKQGLARGIGSLPTVVAFGGIGALVFPSFAVLLITRTLEIVLRGSIYRAGYELLYTPVSVQEKRAAKPVADVVFDRLGDVFGGTVAQVFLAFSSGAFAVKAILLASIGLAGLSLVVTRQLGKLYVRVLEKGLLDRAVELDVDTRRELLTSSVILRTLSLQRRPNSDLAATSVESVSTNQERHPSPSDPVLQGLAELRSGDAERVQRALASMPRLDAVLAPQVIVLLAWDEIAPHALRVLRNGVSQIPGQLVDALLDENSDFAVRRRIPRALAHSDDDRVVQGLIRGLNDSRFEVRFQCARALDVILQRNATIQPNREAVFAIIERELQVSPGIWESRRLLDPRHTEEKALFLDDVLQERANLSWEYIFSLLALILPREPLHIAFQALHTNDRFLRGLALEYLESVLPPTLRPLLNTFETTAERLTETAAQEQVAARLMDARQSVTLKLGAPPSAQDE